MIRKSLLAEFRDGSYSFSDLGNECHQWYLSNFEDDGRMKLLIKILILQDVLLCTRYPEVGYLPVDYFTRENDDVEHIACQTPNAKDNHDGERRQLYIAAMKDLAENIDDTQLLQDIRTLEDDATTAEAAMAIINRYGLNEIKREQVVESYFQNGKNRKRYIRPYTLKVFLSSTNKGGLERWTFEDIRNNTHRLYNETKKWIEEL